MITRLRRTRILVDGDERLAESFANEIARKHRVTVLEDANEGLAMIRMRESARNSRYNLGEVLVTEAKDRVHDLQSADSENSDGPYRACGSLRLKSITTTSAERASEVDTTTIENTVFPASPSDASTAKPSVLTTDRRPTVRTSVSSISSR